MITWKLLVWIFHDFKVQNKWVALGSLGKGCALGLHLIESKITKLVKN